MECAEAGESKHLLQFFPRELTVAQNLCDHSSSQCFPAVDRYNSATAIWMPKKKMAASGADDFEAQSIQSPDESASGDGRQRRHTVTAIR